MLWQRSNAAWRRSGSSVVIVRPEDASEVVRLEGLAASVWVMLVTPATVDDIHAVLVDAAGYGHVVSAAEVETIIGELHRRLVVLRVGSLLDSRVPQ